MLLHKRSLLVIAVLASACGESEKPEDTHTRTLLDLRKEQVPHQLVKMHQGTALNLGSRDSVIATPVDCTDYQFHPDRPGGSCKTTRYRYFHKAGGTINTATGQPYADGDLICVTRAINAYEEIPGFDPMQRMMITVTGIAEESDCPGAAANGETWPTISNQATEWRADWTAEGFAFWNNPDGAAAVPVAFYEAGTGAKLFPWYRCAPENRVSGREYCLPPTGLETTIICNQPPCPTVL